ncbi:MAG: hypothetical protein IT573_05165 [Deltaproteobacteria bacterium]|nr:hypothetical protein [Deltaproteobacteria bacterium]
MGILAVCLWLWGCAGAQAPGGAANPGGGTVGGGGSPLGSGGAAQPMDSGFSGPQKDIHNIHYVIRDGRAKVLCQAGEGRSKVSLEGFLLSQMPSGETYSAVGFLRITDKLAGRYLVTHTSADADKHGFFQAELKVDSGLQIGFDYKQSYEGPLDTLLPVEESQGLSIVLTVVPKPELAVEQGPRADLPCIEKTPEFGIPQEAAAE